MSSNTWLVAASLAVGVAAPALMTSSEPVTTCLVSHTTRQEQSYVRHNRGYPLHFDGNKLDIPACAKYKGPSCADPYCDKYPGLKESGSIRPAPLLFDIAAWSLATAGVLYTASAIFIRK